MKSLNLRWALHLWLPSIALLASTKWSWTKIHWWQINRTSSKSSFLFWFLEKGVNMVLSCVCVCKKLGKIIRLFFSSMCISPRVTTSVFFACRTSISGAGYAPILGFLREFLTEDLNPRWGCFLVGGFKFQPIWKILPSGKPTQHLKIGHPKM